MKSTSISSFMNLHGSHLLGCSLYRYQDLLLLSDSCLTWRKGTSNRRTIVDVSASHPFVIANFLTLYTGLAYTPTGHGIVRKLLVGGIVDMFVERFIATHAISEPNQDRTIHSNVLVKKIMAAEGFVSTQTLEIFNVLVVVRIRSLSTSEMSREDIKRLGLKEEKPENNRE